MVAILKLNSETFLTFVKPYVFVSLTTVPNFKSISYVVININGKKQTDRHMANQSRQDIPLRVLFSLFLCKQSYPEAQKRFFDTLQMYVINTNSMPLKTLFIAQRMSTRTESGHINTALEIRYYFLTVRSEVQF